MTIVCTGFEPFAEFDYNPSADCARAAADALGVEAQVLSVSFEEVERFAETIADASLALHFGLAARRDGVALEAFAHNLCCHDAAAEFDGLGDPLVADGDLCLRTELPLGRWARALSEELEIPVHVSRDAGTYVCNATYYHSLRAMRRRRADGRTGDALFVHVPAVDPPTAHRIGAVVAELLADG